MLYSSPSSLGSLSAPMAISTSKSSTESLRFSQIKRKPPPQEPVSPPHIKAEPRNAVALVSKSRSAGGGPNHLFNDNHFSSSGGTDEFGNSVGSSDYESEERAVKPRVLRANTVPSRRFTDIVRIPPPVVDEELLRVNGLRSMRLLTSASMPDQIFTGVTDHSKSLVSDGVGSSVVLDAAEPEDSAAPAPASVPSPRPKTKSWRKSSFKGEKTAGRVLVAPALQSLPRTPSAISMTSTNASTFSLSSFPVPPDNIPPVPALPPTTSSSSPRFIIQVDPPSRSSHDTAWRPESLSSPLVDAAGDPISPQQSEGTTGERSSVLNDNSAAQRASSSAGFVSDAPSQAPATAKDKTLMPPPPIMGRQEGQKPPYLEFDEPLDDDTFDQTRLPTLAELEEAAKLPVISESGVRVPFGNLWQDKKTIVCFIRHFWCPLCQDYMFSISQNVSAQVLDSAGVQLVIISNGSYEMIKAYRRIFRSPFALYTDPTHNVYNALGMTLQTLEKGPKGTYIRHGMIGGIGWVVVNAVKVGMPVWKEGGEISQLGGEFVMGPGVTCSWAHRMRYTRDHVSILKVVEAAGVDMYTPLHRVASSTGGSFLGMTAAEESKWMERRRKLLKKLRGKKMDRREGTRYLVTVSISTSTNSRRSSLQTSATGSMCSWDSATEEAINVGLSNRDMDAIQEIEEGERAGVVDTATTDTEMRYTLEYTDFNSETASELESAATDTESFEGHSVVEVNFDHTHHGPESKVVDNAKTVSTRGSYSSVGSGYDVAADFHLSLFGISEKSGISLAESMSQSSLGSL